MKEWESHRQTEREWGAPVSLVTPVGNHTLHPMAPDTHTHSHKLTQAEANDMLGNVVRGETWEGENWTMEKNNNKNDQKRWSCVSLFFPITFFLSHSKCVVHILIYYTIYTLHCKCSKTSRLYELIQSLDKYMHWCWQVIPRKTTAVLVPDGENPITVLQFCCCVITGRSFLTSSTWFLVIETWIHLIEYTVKLGLVYLDLIRLGLIWALVGSSYVAASLRSVQKWCIFIMFYYVVHCFSTVCFLQDQYQQHLCSHS